MSIIVKEQAGPALSLPYIGRNLVNFLDGVTLIETRIGVIKNMDIFGENKTMIVSGHLVESLDDPNFIYTDSSTYFDRSPKLASTDGVSLIQVLKDYCEMADIDATPYIDKLKKINENKLLVVPFKPDRVFDITAAASAGGTTTKEMILKALRWDTSKETHKLEASLIFRGKRSRDTSTVVLPIVEYLSTFKLSGIKTSLSDGTNSKDIINFDVSGIIKPIEFSEKERSLILDNAFIYEKIGDKTTIIGGWDNTNNNLVTFKKIGSSKAAKKLTAAVDLIANHKKYIAPYKTFAVNTIKV